MAEYQLRRTLLYVPGNMPSMLQNIPLFQCDGVIIDLEDAVPLSEKDAARILVKRYLESYKERNKEILVRINGLDTKWALDDLKAILPGVPDGIRLPKADTPEIVERLDTLLAACLGIAQFGMRGDDIGDGAVKIGRAPFRLL